MHSLSSKQAVCPGCGFSNPSGNRFCGGCGAPFAERTPAERRQLTTLFCDLVDSTRLTDRLDPEDMSVVISEYQTACTSVIRSFGGNVSRYVGDGILALFGYPRAHEDSADRAVRAGLEIVAAVRALRPAVALDAELAVRIGIATGVVVVGDLIGEGAVEEEAVVGGTPHLAARLQSHAPGNGVVIAGNTRTLLGERFNVVDLGELTMRGFAEPVRAWRVVGARATGSRFDAGPPANRTPLFGRHDELAWLRGFWSQAAQGRGQAVMLEGEAGIGKSRIIDELRDSICAEPCEALGFQCSPHYINTALHPLIEHLERAAGIEREDTSRVKLDKLSGWLALNCSAADAVPVIASLLSIHVEGEKAAPPMSAQRQKERTFELLLGYIERVSAPCPLLVVFEDVHWVDPTTRELIIALIERLRRSRVLLVLTARTDPPVRFDVRAPLHRRELGKLAAPEAVAMAQCVAGDRLPEAVLEHVVTRTDRVPLFIEELTRAVLESRVADRGQPYEIMAVEALPTIPATLHDSLMARLDQLGPAKLIAQFAGAIGREFDYDLLNCVIDVPEPQLRSGLRVLEEAGLVHAKPGPAGPSYAFKHALVQDVAYQSLLRTRRRELHLRIAGALEGQFPQTARDTPELVAYHWTAAGNAERASAGWLEAGKRASERSEYREAIAHLRTGMALVPQVGDSARRCEIEIALLLALAPALITTEGGGTPEVGAMYARALELCNDIPSCGTHFVAHWGWWRASMDHRMGRTRADKLLELSSELGDPGLSLQAHHCQWATLYMLGAHRECLTHAEAGLRLYERERDHAHAALYGGHDAKVCALGEAALSRWMLGDLEASRRAADAALAWSEELSHVGSRVHALDYVLVLQKFRGNLPEVYRRAAELQAYASEQKLRVFRAKGTFFHGWAHALLYDVDTGLREMLDGIASEKAADTPHDFTLYYEMLAEVYAKAGRIDDAFKAIADAFAVAERHGIVFWKAELHRRRGELLVACGQCDAAERAFQDALACSRAQEAKSLELRAAIKLGALRAARGDVASARELLAPVYRSFGEGVESADLGDARGMLEALR